MSSARSSTSSNPPENGASLIPNERIPSRSNTNPALQQIPRELNRNQIDQDELEDEEE